MMPQLFLFAFVVEPRPSKRADARRKKARKCSVRTREFDKALLRIVDGKGSVVRNLVEVTGLSVDSIKSRVKRARYDYDDPAADRIVMDGDMRRYLAGRYRKSKDPVVRNWMAESVTSPTRRRPDWRSSRDGRPA